MLWSASIDRLPWSDVRQHEREYGTKASTMLTLPRAWTPEFALVSVSDVGRISAATPMTSVLGEAQVGQILELTGQSSSAPTHSEGS